MPAFEGALTDAQIKAVVRVRRVARVSRAARERRARRARRGSSSACAASAARARRCIEPAERPHGVAADERRRDRRAARRARASRRASRVLPSATATLRSSTSRGTRRSAVRLTSWRSWFAPLRGERDEIGQRVLDRARRQQRIGGLAGAGVERADLLADVAAEHPGADRRRAARAGSTPWCSIVRYEMQRRASST